PPRARSRARSRAPSLTRRRAPRPRPLTTRRRQERTMSSKIVISSVFALVLSQAGAVYAQSDSAIAQSLFDEGRKLMNEKKFAEACPRLERSYKLDPAAGTLLNVAVCHEGLGRTATAWNEFREAA